MFFIFIFMHLFVHNSYKFEYSKKTFELQKSLIDIRLFILSPLLIPIFPYWNHNLSIFQLVSNPPCVGSSVKARLVFSRSFVHQYSLKTRPKTKFLTNSRQKMKDYRLILGKKNRLGCTSPPPALHTHQKNSYFTL